MSRRLKYLRSALEDLRGLFRHIHDESGNHRIARDFIIKIQGRCARLAALPGTLGRPRPELRPDMRSIAFGNYVIFFRYRDDVFEVVNILEGHRDIIAYFDDDL